MHTQFVQVYNYDELQNCPFCEGSGLLSDGNCEHFVTAFQSGGWAHHLCPPVSCDGFLFHRAPLIVSLRDNLGVLCKKKAGTKNHPAIDAYFCSNPIYVKKVRKQFCKVPVPGIKCGECGNGTAVVDEIDCIVCALCGTPADLEEAEEFEI